MKNKNLKHDSERGAIALLVSMIVLALVFVISISLALVRRNEIQFSSRSHESNVALQMANSGLEYALNEIKVDPAGSTIVGICPVKTSIGEGKYCLELNYNAGNVSTIKSIGEFSKVKRALEATIF